MSRESIFTNPAFHDARLTEKGILQAQNGSAIIQRMVSDKNRFIHGNPSINGDQSLNKNESINGNQSVNEKNYDEDGLILVSSPLSRAITTARYICPRVSHLTVLECLREFAGGHSCDSRQK